MSSIKGRYICALSVQWRDISRVQITSLLCASDTYSYLQRAKVSISNLHCLQLEFYLESPALLVPLYYCSVRQRILSVWCFSHSYLFSSSQKCIGLLHTVRTIHSTVQLFAMLM